MSKPEILSESALVEIEKRHQAATPGPWERGADIECHSEPENCWHTFEKQAEIFPPLGEAGPVAVVSQCEFDNASFVEHARTDIPALIQTVRALNRLLCAADKQASAVHDLVYAKTFNVKAASDAVWVLHGILRAQVLTNPPWCSVCAAPHNFGEGDRCGEIISPAETKGLNHDHSEQHGQR